MIEILNSTQLAQARESGALVGRILQTLRERSTVGTNLLEIDQWTKEMIEEAGAVSCYVDYAPSFGRGPFGHYVCTSVNDAVLHGLPHDYTLADGDHYVYMAGIEDGKVEGQDVSVLLVDPVEFLTGQEAIDAAAADGITLDTDYYVRNPEQTIKHIAVVPEASVTSLSGGSADPVPSSVDDVWQQEYLFKINVGNVRGITTISSIDAVYLP